MSNARLEGMHNPGTNYTSCAHPLSCLTVCVGKVAGRGSAGNYHILCNCKQRWAQTIGLVKFMNAVKKDQNQVWTALEKLGQKRPAQKPIAGLLPATQSRASKRIGNLRKKECPHYDNWITFTAGGSAQGQAPMFHARCKGCKAAWSESAALALVLGRLKASQEAIWAALKDLGVTDRE